MTNSRKGVSGLGPMLSLSLRQFSGQLRALLAQRGFDDVTHAHGLVLEQVVNELGRQSEMASRAQMTKQAFGELVAVLVTRGYLKRRRDPADGRAWTLELSRKGERLVAAVRASQLQIEMEWSRRLGAGRVALLRELLTQLNAGEEAS